MREKSRAAPVRCPNIAAHFTGATTHKRIILGTFRVGTLSVKCAFNKHYTLEQ